MGVIGPKKLCGSFVQAAGPPAAKRSIHCSSCRRSSAKSRSPLTIRLFSVGILRRTGDSPRILFFASGPKMRPMNVRGGDRRPAAISIHAEQCASICAAFMLPHWRALSGRRCVSRFLSSSTVVASKRFFIPLPPLPVLGDLGPRNTAAVQQPAAMGQGSSPAFRTNCILPSTKR